MANCTWTRMFSSQNEHIESSEPPMLDPVSPREKPQREKEKLGKGTGMKEYFPTLNGKPGSFGVHFERVPSGLFNVLGFGRKKEGLGGLKDTTGGNRREDRQVTCKTTFDLITIDAKNAVTVIYMLQSPEENVVLKAVASLEGYARKGPENLKVLSSSGVFPYLLPLVNHADNLLRRFSLKLLGMLCSLEEFREQMFKVEKILDTFVTILEKETDMVLHEYAALILAGLSSEYHAASDLLCVENCIEILFLRITSPDPDVQKNCLDIMSHLLNDVNGIEAFMASSGFDIKLLLDLIPSSYPTIQVLAIEVLKQLTSWCRDTKVLFAFRDAGGVELVLDVLQKEEWYDLYQGALDLLIGIVDSPDFCDYLLQSGCLMRLIKLMDNFHEKTDLEKILRVLARMSQTRKGRLALHSVEMEEKFCTYLEDTQESIQEPSCLGIANLAQNGFCLESIMNRNPVNQLLTIVISREKNLSLRNLAAHALNTLCNYDKRAAESLLENERLEELFAILSENSILPTELCQNLIQVFMGISFYDQLRVKLINERFLSALISCFPKADSIDTKDTSLQVDALECLSGYLVEAEARLLFDSLDGVKIVMNCLQSKFASVREWAGHLVVISSQSKDFVKAFIQKGGLDWMLKEKNTLHSMPSWQSGIEAIFSSHLPAKFAYTGRLDLQDITQDGFYISTNPSSKFILLDYFLKARISPLTPIYVANFFSSIETPQESETTSLNSHHSENKSQQSVSDLKIVESQNLKKVTKGADRNSREDFVWDESVNIYTSTSNMNSINAVHSECNLEKICPDPYLNEYLEDLKRKISKAELHFGDINWHCIHPKLICERARIIGELVADEMSGPEADPVCYSHYKQSHINELKFHLGSNIIPLGLIRMGSYLERAMLFKVLSDRIGFPCALIRGPYGRSWIEIAVPVLRIEEFGEEPDSMKDKTNCPSWYSEPKFSAISVINQTSQSCSPSSTERQRVVSTFQEEPWFPRLRLECFKAFPDYFLKTNAIVDLINVPGRILKINSLEAAEYTGAFLFSKC